MASGRDIQGIIEALGADRQQLGRWCLLVHHSRLYVCNRHSTTATAVNRGRRKNRNKAAAVNMMHCLIILLSSVCHQQPHVQVHLLQSSRPCNPALCGALRCHQHSAATFSMQQALLHLEDLSKTQMLHAQQVPNTTGNKQ